MLFVIYGAERLLMDQRLQKLKKLSSMDDIKRRRAEVNNLIKEVLAREDDGGYAKYAFMLGDYNLNLENSDAKNQRASIEPVIWYREGTSEEKEFVIKQDKLTTLKTPPKEENDPNDEYGKLMFDARVANNYDHFTYNSQISQLVLKRPQPVVFRFCRDCGTSLAYRKCQKAPRRKH